MDNKRVKDQKYMGIDIGSSTIKIVILDGKDKISYEKKRNHFGEISNTLKDMVFDIMFLYGEENFKILFTGTNSNSITDKKFIISDIPAIQRGLSIVFPQANSVVEIGSQNARFLTGLNRNIPPKFSTNEDCAGGTGSFFEDQMYRLGLNIDDYSNIIKEAHSIPKLSGRCSVFAKSDIIHRQQDGVSTPDILLGLCYATIRNFKATIIKNLPIEKPLALCGGIINNIGVNKAVKEIFKLEDGDFLVDKHSEYVQAFGAAVFARESDEYLEIDVLYRSTCLYLESNLKDENIRRLNPLVLLGGIDFGEPVCESINGFTECSLGIDIGSTSTNLVLIDNEGRIVDFQYLRTKGDPKGVVEKGIQNIEDKFGNSIDIKGIGVTGSGRHLVGKMIDANCIRDEITAQAKAAVDFCQDVDTIFEIGGQDSKYIQIEDGIVKDFQMNKICAAGTGSFIEEQASRLGVELKEYGKLSLSADKPVDLGERCTVFIESNISNCISKGVNTENILAGLCHSIVRNYLFKVVGNKPVGEHIVLQGGVCYNSGIIAAFQGFYGGKITVSPYFSVSGAYGMAIIAREEIQSNQREEVLIGSNINFYDRSKELLFDGYTRKFGTKKQIIGVPYVLVVHKLFPMIRSYFEKLGYNVLLSPETDEDIISLAQEHAKSETCYPVKLIYGHMAWLTNKGVDYIFLPSILTMKHESSKVYKNYGCVYMQSAPRLIFDSMKLFEKGIKLLNPMFSLDFGKKAIAEEMVGVGVSLGKSKPACMKALLSGAMAVKKHTNKIESLGKDLIASLEPEEKVIVMVTRTYGIDDPILNMGIPQELLKRGYKVISLSHLPAHDLDISEEYENLYWPFGQHIISGAKLISNHPNLYAVYLTNHGCGPDTMLSHLFQREMGSKPYLNIEVDEHFSKVGVITRIEAFLNSLNAQGKVNIKDKDNIFSNLPKRDIQIISKIKRGIPIYLPYLYPYSQIIAGVLKEDEYKAEVLPQTDVESLVLGRSITKTKEYLSFAAIAGDILKINKKSGEKVQVLVPKTEGSEADGMYARVIYELLPEDKKVEIVGIKLETLPFENRISKRFFLGILAGDIILSAGITQRQEIFKEVLAKENLSLEYLRELSMGIDSNKRDRIAVVGEPYIVYNDYLNGNLLRDIEEEGRDIAWMPLSEYLCFMWKKRAEKKEEKETVDEFERQIAIISDTLGENSPFSQGIDILQDISNKSLPEVIGGNIGYRFSKQNSISDCKAILSVCSMYENSQTIIDLAEIQNDIPTLSLSFEGGNSLNEREKLNSFLYYMSK